MAKKSAKKATKKQPPLVVWVARDADHRGRYGLFLSEPYLDSSFYYYCNEWDAELVSALCPNHFEPMMVIKLEPGEKRQFVWTGSPLKPYKPTKRKATKRAK